MTGMAYSVSIKSEPAGFSCSLDKNTGKVGTSDIKNIGVTCSVQSFALSGSINGLTTSGLVLVEGADSLTLPSNAATFSMPTPIAFRSNYIVSIAHQPLGGKCAITNGAGTVPATAVSNVVVSCSQLASEAVVYSFGSTASDGAAPSGALTQANDGNLYGMTSAGGVNGTGTVFQIVLAKTTPTDVKTVATVLHSFGASSGGDGAQPKFGSLVQATDRNLYGMTMYGGANNLGAVIKVTLNGEESVIHSFGGQGDGSLPYGSLIQAIDGYLYGMTSGGGANGTGAVVRLDTNGAEIALYSFGGPDSGDGTTPIGSLVQGSDGSLYGMTYSGGSGDFGNGGTVVKIALAGAETVLHSFIELGNVNGATPSGNLIQGTDGSFYGFAYGGPMGAGVVLKVTPAGVVSVLGDFSPCCGVNAGGSLFQSADGSLYGMASGGEYDTGTLIKVSQAGVLTVLYSFGEEGRGDGENPSDGSLIQSTDGTFYFTTPSGGSNGKGAVVKFKLN